MAGDRTRSRSSTLARFARDQRGITAVLVALTLVALIGFTGLGVDAGWWYTIKRQNQSAADAAAISAAYEIIADLAKSPPVTPTPANLSPVASDAATQNRWVNTGTDPAITYPCPAATCPVGTGGVEVILHQQQNSWFASLLSLASVDVANRAVALVQVLDNPCILALNPTADQAINLQGNPTVNAPDCSIVADSTKSDAIHLQGSASITAKTLVTPGAISYTGNGLHVDANPLIGTAASAVPDPFLTTPSHADLTNGGSLPATLCTKTSTNPDTYNGNCQIGGTGNGANNLSKSNNISLAAKTRITSDLTIKNQTVNLAPGTYWITDGSLNLQANGHLTCTGCTGGAGVTIILTTTNTASGVIGTVTMASNSSITLTAPSTGSFAGMLIMQDKASNIGAGVTYASSQASFQGGAGGSIGGLLYLPHEQVTMQGNPNASCSLLIADTIVMKGDPTFTLAGCPNSLTNQITVKTVALME